MLQMAEPPLEGTSVSELPLRKVLHTSGTLKFYVTEKLLSRLRLWCIFGFVTSQPILTGE